jgi:exodeoxyribonuclease VII small subunit
MKDVKELNFEQAMEELETIVRKLEAGQDSLENSITLYERGVALKQLCEKKLQEATLKIEKITIPG